ncbi:MAG: hypothetical protein OEZ13_06130 [Spirochaetia bacterium]|nr:hypothetical protein [Spirochaetia bacterium]
MNIKLLNKAAKKEISFFIQFGGQGAFWYKEFLKYLENPAMKPFYEAVINGIKEGLGYIKSSEALLHGFELEKWINDPDSLPDEEYLYSAPISLPMIQAAQFAHYENFRLKGYNKDSFVEYSKGASGHSQGLISASFPIYDMPEEEYYETIKSYTIYLFLMGLRAQETQPGNLATSLEKERADSLGLTNPAPMAALLGSNHKQVEKLTDNFNETVAKDEKIYVSLYNTPENRIISGPRGSLLDFYEKYKEMLEESKIDFIFLKTSCPFHCDHMLPIREVFNSDMKNIGFELFGSKLKLPLYSFFDGRNMQKDEKLAMTFCDELMIKPLFWEKGILRVIKENEITHIIDFGPGKTSQRLSADILKSHNCEKPILSAAVIKDQKILFETE